MTVSSTTSRKTFVGDNATTSFATSPIVFFGTDDLTVYAVTTATGAATTLTEGVHYTVSGGAGSTGTVSLAGGSSPYGAPASTVTLVIVRELDLVQEVDFVNNEGTDAEVAEDALDKLTMMAQQLSARIDRAFVFPDSDVSGADTAIPTPVIDGVLKWNAAGTALEAVPLAGIAPDTVSVSSFAETLLDDTTAAAARATLGAVGVGEGDAAFTTGDVKLTLKTTADSGWVLCNDGTIGSASSGATTRANADTEDLFTLLWNNVNDTYAPVSSGRGVNAAVDFAANKTIALTKMLGRAFGASGAGAGLTSRALGETLGAQDAITVAHTHTGPSHTHTGPSHTHTGTTANESAHTHAQATTTVLNTGAASFAPGNPTVGSGTGGTTGAGAAHSHTFTTDAGGTGNTGASGTGATGSTGGSATDANMPPMTFLNAMIKL